MILDKYFLDWNKFSSPEYKEAFCRVLAVFVAHSVAAAAIRQWSCKIFACQM